MRTRTFWLIPLLVACAACADPRPGERASGTSVDTLPDGRVRVANRGPGAWTPATAWRLEEDLRLGSVDGPEPERFTFIAGVLTDTDGRIYVLEGAAQEIRVFLPDGTYSHTIGGRGAGPGEFTRAMGMAFAPGGDTLWVTDTGNQRYSAFAPDGRFIGSVPRKVQQYGGPGEFVAREAFLDWGLGFPDERPGVVAGGRVLLHPIRLSPGFGDSDSLPPLEYAPETVAHGQFPQPFFSRGLAVATDRHGGIWFAHTESYTVYRRSLEGDTTLAFSRAVEPAPVGDAERDYVRKVTSRRPDMARLYLDALPASKPVIVAIFTDNAGHVFVVPETADAPGGSVLDVFRDTGELLGRLPLPQPALVTPLRAFVAHATPEHLYVVVTDENEVPYVSRARIIRGRR